MEYIRKTKIQKIIVTSCKMYRIKSQCRHRPIYGNGVCRNGKVRGGEEWEEQGGKGSMAFLK